MAVTGLNSAQCIDYVPFASTFWHHFNATMIIFILSIFALPSLAFLIVRIGALPNHALPSAPRNDNNNLRTSTQPDNDDSYVSDKSKAVNPRIVVAKFVASTILLGITTCGFTFQILFALFTGYCLKGIVRPSDLVCACVVASLAAMFLVFALTVWLAITIMFVKIFASWLWDMKHRPMNSIREHASEDTTNANATTRRQSQDRNEQVNDCDPVKSALPTLPPYMV